MSRHTNPESLCLNGGSTHSHQSGGLDVRGGQLVNTRRCVWCDHEETKPYGAGGNRGWKTTKAGTR
jgi:hypothetical protein